ncbi:MAG: hypothetical protein ACI4WH_06660 [Oscillospiraceae bacterium]
MYEFLNNQNFWIYFLANCFPQSNLKEYISQHYDVSKTIEWYRKSFRESVIIDLKLSSKRDIMKIEFNQNGIYYYYDGVLISQFGESTKISSFLISSYHEYLSPQMELLILPCYKDIGLYKSNETKQSYLEMLKLIPIDLKDVENISNMILTNVLNYPSNIKHTIYRYMKGRFLLYVNLCVRIVPLENQECVKISDSIGVRISKDRLYIDRYPQDNVMDLPRYIFALNYIKDTLSRYCKDKILIEIMEDIIHWCDFQGEELSMALIQLLSETYGFPMPNVGITFNHDKNKYIFDWGTSCD